MTVKILRWTPNGPNEYTANTANGRADVYLSEDGDCWKWQLVNAEGEITEWGDSRTEGGAKRAAEKAAQ